MNAKKQGVMGQNKNISKARQM